MTLATQVTAATDPVFVGLVQQAIIVAAINISAEARNTPDDANRIAFAKSVLNSPASFAPNFAQGVASQGLDKNSADAAISTAVAAIWNAYAGVV